MDRKPGIRKGTKLQHDPMTGIMLRLSVAQAEALTRVAEERGINRAELLRKLIEDVTGVEDTVMQKRPQSPGSAQRDHVRDPDFIRRNREIAAAKRRRRKKETG
jgi:hypothetical protein